jgi:hypothetical protein
MKVKGNILLIHKLDNLWIFKFEMGKSIYRVPVVFDIVDYHDGQEVEGLLYDVDGITYARISGKDS